MLYLARVLEAWRHEDNGRTSAYVEVFTEEGSPGILRRVDQCAGELVVGSYIRVRLPERE